MDLNLWQMFDQTPFQVLPPVLWWRSFPCPPRIVICYASWYSHGQPVREQLKGHLWPWAVACPTQENLLCPNPLTLSHEWRTPALTSSLAPWAKRTQPPSRLCGASPRDLSPDPQVSEHCRVLNADSCSAQRGWKESLLSVSRPQRGQDSQDCQWWSRRLQ